MLSAGPRRSLDRDRERERPKSEMSRSKAQCRLLSNVSSSLRNPETMRVCAATYATPHTPQHARPRRAGRVCRDARGSHRAESGGAQAHQRGCLLSARHNVELRFVHSLSSSAAPQPAVPIVWILLCDRLPAAATHHPPLLIACVGLAAHHDQQVDVTRAHVARFGAAHFHLAHHSSRIPLLFPRPTPLRILLCWLRRLRTRTSHYLIR